MSMPARWKRFSLPTSGPRPSASTLCSMSASAPARKVSGFLKRLEVWRSMPVATSIGRPCGPTSRFLCSTFSTNACSFALFIMAVTYMT